jgi:hypothetical protein
MPKPKPQTVAKTVSIFVRDLMGNIYESMEATDSKIQDLELALDELAQDLDSALQKIKALEDGASNE